MLRKSCVTTKLDFAWSNGWSWFYGHKHRNHGQKRRKWASSKHCVDHILECERLCNLRGAQSRATEESASKEVSWVTLGMSLVSLEYFLFGLFWICIIRRRHWESLTLDFVLIFCYEISFALCNRHRKITPSLLRFFHYTVPPACHQAGFVPR